MTIKKLNAFLFAAVVALQGCGSGTENHKPAPTPEPEPEPEPMSIVDVAVANGSFTTLVTALEATGLDVTLRSYNFIFTFIPITNNLE